MESSARWQDTVRLQASSVDGSKDVKPANALSTNQQRASCKTSVGMQSGYMKGSLSTISEDALLDERAAMQWEALRGWKGNAASPHTHGIMLPDWQVWAEQVSQLLNHFAIEINLLTSRIDRLDQQILNQTTDVSMYAASAPPHTNTAHQGGLLNGRAEPLSKGNELSMSKEIFGEGTSASSLTLTTEELNWLMAPERCVSVASSPLTEKDGGRQLLHTPDSLLASNSTIAAEYAETSTLQESTIIDFECKIPDDASVGEAGIEENTVGHDDVSAAQAIRTEAERDRQRQLQEMQKWQTKHLQENSYSPHRLLSSPVLDKFRSP
eukprot:CAMPEP_0169420832 /NCGR_PEP_ID=MMETSP1017-20121227/65763_1 /TAXON_ID=342587 /ORGANISM="Karlodinium micrum, Strain CCMP2283" /LENGTH=323 /DNA_ID=CAMNT_0009529667 /DNA_START=1 /DNA_END=970 /DNA_ORIENTATION=+